MHRLALSLVLFASAGFAQEASQPKIFNLDPAWSKQETFEFATAVRSISDISQLLADPDKHTLTLRGTQTQIKFVEWFQNTLADQALRREKGVSSEFKVINSDGEFSARLVFLSTVEGGKPLHDVAVKVRLATEMSRLFSLSGPRAIIVRGTPGQMKQADELIRQLDKI